MCTGLIPEKKGFNFIQHNRRFQTNEELWKTFGLSSFCSFHQIILLLFFFAAAAALCHLISFWTEALCLIASLFTTIICRYLRREGLWMPTISNVNVWLIDKVRLFWRKKSIFFLNIFTYFVKANKKRLKLRHMSVYFF